MQTNSVDLRTSAQNSPALGGLAASPAQSARGSTNKGWRSLSDLVGDLVHSASGHCSANALLVPAYAARSTIAAISASPASPPSTASVAGLKPVCLKTVNSTSAVTSQTAIFAITSISPKSLNSKSAPAAADRASFSSHEAAAAGAGRATPPDGNHGGYFSGERTSV